MSLGGFEYSYARGADRRHPKFEEAQEEDIIGLLPSTPVSWVLLIVWSPVDIVVPAYLEAMFVKVFIKICAVGAGTRG